MQKIISKILLIALMFSTVSMQGAGLSALWNKHSSAILTSLYILGASAIVYACHRDTEKRVKVLKREEQVLKKSEPKLSIQNKRGLDKQKRLKAKEMIRKKEEEHKQKLEDQKDKIAVCYGKPVQLALFFALIGGSIKLYNAYFK